jgi:hypothetical protein
MEWVKFIIKLAQHRPCYNLSMIEHPFLFRMGL